jgi:hypothetical protein
MLADIPQRLTISNRLKEGLTVLTFSPRDPNLLVSIQQAVGPCESRIHQRITPDLSVRYLVIAITTFNHCLLCLLKGLRENGGLVC